MNPNATIESYVGDVVSQLPRKQRNDVAFELRSLLTEELQGRGAEAGRDPDAAMTLELLADFGRPADVADRYRPAGFTIIRPADAPRFARVGLGGVALLWVLSLVTTFAAPVDPAAGGPDWLSRLGSWWLSWGLGSFWWPGFLVSLSIIAGWIASRREGTGACTVARVRSFDRDRISRPVMVLLLALGVVGASTAIAVTSIEAWGSGLPEPLVAALAFDQRFLASRAVWALLLWAVSLALGIAVLVAGRWGRLTRRLGLAASVAWMLLMGWWIVGGPIFVAQPADDVTKLCLLLVIALVVLDIVMTIRRIASPIRVPAV